MWANKRKFIEVRNWKRIINIIDCFLLFHRVFFSLVLCVVIASAFSIIYLGWLYFQMHFHFLYLVFWSPVTIWQHFLVTFTISIDIIELCQKNTYTQTNMGKKHQNKQQKIREIREKDVEKKWNALWIEVRKKCHFYLLLYIWYG